MTVSLYAGAALGILSGLTTRGAIAGVADFSGLSIDAEGAYSLMAVGTEVFTAYKPSAKVSSGFVIGATITVTAGTDTSPSGTEIGFNTQTAIGSVDPTKLLGQDVAWIISVELAGPTFFTGVAVFGNVPQSFFTSVTINGMTFNTVDAGYTYNAGLNITDWVWVGQSMPTLGTYEAAFL